MIQKESERKKKQAHLAMGVGLVAAAMEQIDSTPIDRFARPTLMKCCKLKKEA